VSREIINSVKRGLSWFLYACGAFLVLAIIVIEFSPEIDITSSGKLMLSGTVMLLLTAAAMLRNATLQSPVQRMRTTRATLWAIFLLYIFYLIWLLFFDSTYNRVGSTVDYSVYIQQKTNFTPFITIRRYLRNITLDRQTHSAILNLLGNLIAFMPVGFFAPLLFWSMRKFWIFIPTLLLVLVGVEGLQLWMRVGSCDIDDVILNLIGALMVYFFMKIPPIKRILKKLY